MPRYRVSRNAIRDLDAIWYFIAKDNEAAAALRRELRWTHHRILLRVEHAPLLWNWYMVEARAPARGAFGSRAPDRPLSQREGERRRGCPELGDRKPHIRYSARYPVLWKKKALQPWT